MPVGDVVHQARVEDAGYVAGASAMAVVLQLHRALPRHASQLYQIALEAAALMSGCSRAPRPTGQASALFLIGYGDSRFIAEFAREPGQFPGLLAANLSMGQWLSLADGAGGDRSVCLGGASPGMAHFACGKNGDDMHRAFLFNAPGLAQPVEQRLPLLAIAFGAAQRQIENGHAAGWSAHTAGFAQLRHQRHIRLREASSCARRSGCGR